jgi:uncharacterized protein involved in response to NO
LGGAAWGLVALSLWLCSRGGLITLPTAFGVVAWHRHEMLFGFIGAVMAGFLLTTIPELDRPFADRRQADNSVAVLMPLVELHRGG